ncbi:hypothetical protein AMTRI_Chr09g34230 [Amborella trichopoda]
MGPNASGVVLASSPPIAVAGTISRMLDGPLLGEEPPNVKGKALAGSPIPNLKVELRCCSARWDGWGYHGRRHLFARGTFPESQGKCP